MVVDISRNFNTHPCKLLKKMILIKSGQIPIPLVQASRAVKLYLINQKGVVGSLRCSLELTWMGNSRKVMDQLRSDLSC